MDFVTHQRGVITEAIYPEAVHMVGFIDFTKNGHYLDKFICLLGRSFILQMWLIE